MATSKLPTMVDVARRAGVGLTTVSRHVDGAVNIRPGMVARF